MGTATATPLTACDHIQANTTNTTIQAQARASTTTSTAVCELELTPQQSEALAWWESHLAARERGTRSPKHKNEPDEPFEEFCEKLFERLRTKTSALESLYDAAERMCETVVNRYAERVRANITQSRQIPAFCRLPYSVRDTRPDGEVCAAIHEAAANGKNLYISGAVGVGKTYVACQCVYLWCMRNLRFTCATSLYDVAVNRVPPQPVIENFHETLPVKNYPVFLSARDFLYELRATFDGGGGGESEVLQKYLSIPILIVDDLGAEKITDWTRDRMFFLLDKRLYDTKKQTIITSNHRIGELAAVLDDRLASRIAETCTVFRLEGADKRIKNMNLKEENER
jgi:DNA replication protein DnaC